MDKKHDIFVSYSRHDTNVVNEFVERLEREGFSVWIDRDGIESGDAFKKIILQAIKNSAVVLFFSSQFSNQSGWTAKEIGVAVKYKKTVIPILLDGSNYNEEVEFDLINLDFIDYQDVTVRGIMMDRLVKSLKTKITNPMGQKKAEEARLKAEAAERERLEKERLKKEEAEKKAREEAERQAREAAERERRALQATSVSPTPHSDTPNPPKKKTLWIALAIVTVVVILVGLVFIYVPNIRFNVNKERTQRLAVDFAREVQKIQSQSPELCKKYELTSLDEPIVVDWSEDSSKMVEGLMKFITLDEYKVPALQLLEQQRILIEQSRKADFDRLLLNEFKYSNDSIAVTMRSALYDPTDEQLLFEAAKWYGIKE